MMAGRCNGRKVKLGIFYVRETGLGLRHSRTRADQPHELNGTAILDAFGQGKCPGRSEVGRGFTNDYKRSLARLAYDFIEFIADPGRYWKIKFVYQDDVVGFFRIGAYADIENLNTTPVIKLTADKLRNVINTGDTHTYPQPFEFR
jgi:hypothetical protein